MAVSRTEQQRVVDRFLAAVTAGDVQGLMDVLAPDVIVVADSGGLAPAIRRPLTGSRRVAAALSHFAELVPHVEITTPLVNGTVAARIDPGGEFDTAITFVVEGGRITRMYAMRNPHKLGRLDEVAELRR
jgi:RNA polymerase sigma-70 factor (ECF subfamily)